MSTDSEGYTRREVIKDMGVLGGAFFGLDHAMNIGAQARAGYADFQYESQPNADVVETIRKGEQVEVAVYDFGNGDYDPDVFKDTITSVQQELEDVDVAVSYSTVPENLAAEQKERINFQEPDKMDEFLDTVEDLTKDEDIAVWLAEFDTEFNGVSMSRGDILVDRSGSPMYDANIANHEIGHELGLEHTTYAYDTMSYAPTREAVAYLRPVPYSFESHQNWTTTLDS